VLKAGARQSVAVAVKPYLLAEAGKYPIQVKVSAPEGTAEAELNVVLTGTHKIEVGTASGLLSLTAMTGKPANMSFYVKNTAPLLRTTSSCSPSSRKLESGIHP